ncbi:MAG: FAD-dependent oxidoreductase [Micromonosporaceae bacterium]|nr:FAD-dependent oxidoreductase [Micromonosporaceae bacterium]
MTHQHATDQNATDQFVIVGGGLAGATAAQTLREEGFAGPILLIGAEPHRPYERPPLSKGYLTGGADRESVFVHPADWYRDHDVTLLTGVRVTAIDRSARAVVTADGTQLRYTKLLLATGSTARPLPAPGADLENVLTLRTMADADRLAPHLVPDAHVVVIGGGWIGLEVAAAARQRGARVTVVETATLPLQRVLGREVAQFFADLHVANGVQLLTGRSVRELRGNGRVESVELTDGTVLRADLVVVGIGVWPTVDLALAAGLAVRDGVMTDASLRTSDPDIFAAGDIAEFEHPRLGRTLRVEHWANARDSAAVAARAMLGQPAVHDAMPYFYTDQYDLGMEYRGHVEPGGYDQVVFRGPNGLVDGKTPETVVFWTQQARVLAAMNVNSWDDGPALERLVQAGHAGRQVDLDRLADPTVPLDALLDPVPDRG